MAEVTKLGRYQLRRVLGKGAMGVVYEGFDPTLNRRVAVKIILRSIAIDAETAAAYSGRFVKEAQAVARLNHPHIVQVFDFGEQDEIAYLVMEFIEGRELRDFFDKGERFEPSEAARIAVELLEALHFAHERGVIHRDVKPANVMLDSERRVKLADFGVARIQESERSTAGTLVGTPAFMSPEQIQGGRIDRRTDIFSAGVVLYQLLTGEQPFKGEGAWTVAKQIMQDDPTRPSTVVKNVSPALDAVVQKALAKSPDQRYANAKEFAGALRSEFASALKKVPAHSTAPSATQTLAATAPRWRSIAAPAAIVGLVTIAAVVAFVVVWRSHEPAPVPQAPLPDVEKIKRETEARVRQEMEAKIAEQKAAEKAAEAKLASERAVLEQATAEREAKEKAAAAKLAAAKAAAEKAAAVARERAAAERIASGKSAADKAALKKADEEKPASEPNSAKTAVARRPGWPAVGDQWVYEANDSGGSGRHFQITVEIKAVGQNGVTEIIHRGNGDIVETLQQPSLHFFGVSPGIVAVSPYLPTFQDLRDGRTWNDIRFGHLFSCNKSGVTCTVNGRVAGREQVHVKAGTFDAVKVVFDVSLRGRRGNVNTVQVRYWYAEAASRFVKYELRKDSENVQQPPMDMELVSYTRAGG